MKRHLLKTWPTPFADMKAGIKTFEYRFDDRGFAVGDVLDLVEYDPNDGAELGLHHTAKSLFMEVTYILRGGQFGIPGGYVVMAIKPWKPQSLPTTPE